MTRHALIAFVLAVPVLAAPQLKPVTKKVPSLAGTTWTGNSFEKQTMVLVFQADGTMTATYNGGAIANPGWSQDKDKIHFHLNNMYLKFDGKIVGDKVVGECYNIAGTRWDVTLTRNP